MGFDPNTPRWVQHIALELEDMQALEAAKKSLEESGIDVLGITDHGIFKSIYFFDPNGHRIELTADISTEEQRVKLKEVAWDMLEEWSQTKQPPRQSSWLHADEFTSK